MSDRGFARVKGCEAAFKQEPTAFTVQEIGIGLSANVSMEVSVLGVKKSGQHLARWLVATGTWVCVCDEWMSPQKSWSKWNPRTTTVEAIQDLFSLKRLKRSESDNTLNQHSKTVPIHFTLSISCQKIQVMLEYDGMSQTVRSVSLPPTYRNLMSKIQFAPQLTLVSGQSLVIQQLESSTTV